MALSSRIKHVLQCICLFSWVFIFCYVSGGIRFGEDPVDLIDPWTSYGPLLTMVLMLVRMFALLALPQVNAINTHLFLQIFGQNWHILSKIDKNFKIIQKI